MGDLATAKPIDGAEKADKMLSMPERSQTMHEMGKKDMYDVLLLRCAFFHVSLDV